MNSFQDRLARRLVRLYPPAWRARYGDELLALVEQTGLGPLRALDLLFGAVREWFSELVAMSAARPGFRALCELTISGAIWTCGLVMALWLRATVDTLPVISFVDGHRSVLPPRLPSYLAGAWYLVVAAVSVNEWWAWREQRRGRPVPTWASRRFLFFLAALAATTPLAMWANLVAHYGTGLPPTPVMSQLLVAVFVVANVRSLFDRLHGTPARRENRS